MGDIAPAILYSRQPCPKCGAVTEKEAETKCQPVRDFTDEYTCPGGERADAEGFILLPTAESLAALDAWCDEQMRAEERSA